MEKETKLLLAGLPCRDQNNFCKATKEALSLQQNKFSVHINLCEEEDCAPYFGTCHYYEWLQYRKF